MKDIRVGFAFCGSYCTYDEVMPALETAAARYKQVIPLVSEQSAQTDTRYGCAHDFMMEMERICKHRVLKTISDAEPLGPKGLIDVLVIAPCTSNTLAKLAHGINDTAVTMAAKSTLRNGLPVVIGISTNDGLAISARNIGDLLCRKNFYFVPFRQDDPFYKPNSLRSDMGQIPATLEMALEGKQLHPLIIAPVIH